jgi:AraC-like DNA-binding protein
MKLLSQFQPLPSAASTGPQKSTTQTALERLARSPIYQQYERAFGDATGLPLKLRSADDMSLTHRGSRHENPFCALLAKQNKACAACLRTQHELSSLAREHAHTVTCHAGLSETAIPLRAGENVIGFLCTGEVLSHQPNAREYGRVTRRLAALGVDVAGDALREAYFQSQVLPARRYESVLKLLEIFSQHLSLVAGQIAFQTENAELPSMTKAREFISANHAEDLTLAQVAQAVHMSTFYFCKQFKKATGLTFTDYLSRVRIESAKQQLLKPHARVSEVAYEVGFQSLTHFNRVFRKLNGESPSSYRTHLPLSHGA